MPGLPAASHFSRDWPPFQARVVKPRISTLTPQRSSVRARMSAQVAATVIGRPRIEPELSSSSVTTVSRNCMSCSTLKDSGMERIDDDARQAGGIEQAFLEIEIPGAVLLRHQPALQAVGEPRHHALKIGQLLVEIVAQPRQLLAVAEILGGDLLVELVGVDPVEIVVARATRTAVAAARAPRRPALSSLSMSSGMSSISSSGASISEASVSPSASCSLLGRRSAGLSCSSPSGVSCWLAGIGLGLLALRPTRRVWSGSSPSSSAMSSAAMMSRDMRAKAA